LSDPGFGALVGAELGPRAKSEAAIAALLADGFGEVGSSTAAIERTESLKQT
jgi:hypothetical protein